MAFGLCNADLGTGYRMQWQRGQWRGQSYSRTVTKPDANTHADT